MGKRLPNLALIGLATAAWSFGFGVGSQVVSHWMNEHGADNTVIGLNHSSHYLGLALGSLAVPWLARRLGPRSAALGMLACGPTLAIFPWAGGPLGWFVLRLLNGAASALSLIPLEAFISRAARPEKRARDFAFYGVALTLGGAFGIWAGLQCYEAAEVLTFYLGAAAPVLGGLAVLTGLRAEPATAPRQATGATRFRWRRHFLSFGTAWSQGFLEGGLLAFLALYLEWRGLSAYAAGDLIGVTMVGVIVFQVPVSWIADRCGRVPVLLGCYAVAMAGLALVPFCPGTVILACCLFAFGACSGAMYPLGLALLGEGLSEAALARVYSWYLAVECAGSLMGAPAMGWARDLGGDDSMFTVGLAALGLVVAGWAGLRLSLRRTSVVEPSTAEMTSRAA
jgi:MFS family permease